MIDHGLGLQTTLPRGEMLRFVGGTTAIGGLVAAAVLRYFWVAAQWQRGVQGEARAQVIALQARIRPHFLFNSMNTIASLIRVRPDDAERAVEDLSDLFRAALNAGDQLVPLSTELELVDRYLDIEALRLGSKLRIERNLADAPADLQIPALLLQPLVENAVLHGVQALAAGGTIVLDARVDGDGVVITIRNPRPDVPVERPGNGTALDNVRQRMHYHYGDRARLAVDAGQGYYAVTLVLPRT
jgi:two-component system sensor histidine kinase AlgZ